MTELAPAVINPPRQDLHNGLACDNCGTQFWETPRFLCLHCDNYQLCETCHETPKVLPRHDPTRTHIWAKIKNSTVLSPEKLEKYRASVREPRHDAYAFHTWEKQRLQNDPRALEIIKSMLRTENSYRLGEEYQTQYKKRQDDEWKTKITVEIQTRVVNEFQDKAVGIYSGVDEGLNFLRAAVGNFGEDHLEELMDCANYVKYTQSCKRGPLRAGDIVDCTKIPLFHPVTGKQELLSEWLVDDKPLVIIASSYT